VIWLARRFIAFPGDNSVIPREGLSYAFANVRNVTKHIKLMKQFIIRLIGLLFVGGIVQAQDANFSGKVFLQGAYEPSSSLMRTALVQQNDFPLLQPYNTAPWFYAGTEYLSATQAGMVDWILLDLRISPDTAIDRKAAILYSDGSIRDVSGDSVLIFNVPPGDYYIAIMHRSHLSAMSAEKYAFPSGVTFDFSDSSNQVYGICRISLGSDMMGLISGDLNQDRVLKYSGSGNDRSLILQCIMNQGGGTAINATVSGYFKEDLRMDGTVKYSGSGNDPSLIIQNLIALTGSTAINSTFTGSVPHPVLLLPPAQPSPVLGPTEPCENTTGLIYSVMLESGVSYAWTVPAGWSITAGQGSHEITVTAGTSTGTIEVTPSNTSGNGPSQSLAVTTQAIPPAQPTAIVGEIDPCEGASEIYSVTFVNGVTYTWSVPASWSINFGQGTHEVTVTLGSATGNIEVVPSNACGSGPSQMLNLTAQLAPDQPSIIYGDTNPCEGSNETYSVNQLAGVTYSWTIPSDWSITSGQGTHEIMVTTGSAVGIIEVSPSNICIGPSQTLAVTPYECYVPGYVHCDPANPTAVVDVTNPATGKTWMDRNLGASRVATASDDSEAYGDLYQWGRFADGHQCRTSTVTSTLSTSNTPAHGNFILVFSTPHDWRSPQNQNLWQGISGINNPCPEGYRLPTEAELNTEYLSWTSSTAASAFNSPLKLPVAGLRLNILNGALSGVGSFGAYWSSNVSSTLSRSLFIGNAESYMTSYNRSRGNSVRCIKASLPVLPSPITGATEPCENATGLLYSIIQVTGQTYNWSVPAGWTINTGQGTHEISLTVGTSNGIIEVTPSNSAGAGPSQTLVVNTLVCGTGSYPENYVHCDSANPTALVEVINPATGKIWMDRNLGAIQAASSSIDELAYGDLYQWGRFADGHQCRNSSTTPAISMSDQPGHGSFITMSSSPYDWRNPQNESLWQGKDGQNNPCPYGYRLPSAAELNAERLSWVSNNPDGAYASPLKLTTAGFRHYYSPGGVSSSGSSGDYWSSTISTSGSYALSFNNYTSGYADTVSLLMRARGLSVRCIKAGEIPTQPSPIIGPTNSCENETELVYFVSQETGITYLWSVPLGCTIDSGQGTNQISLTAGSSSGTIEVTPLTIYEIGPSQTLFIDIQVAPTQTSAIAGEPKPCKNMLEQYSVTQEVGESYTWTIPADWNITSGQGTHVITVNVGSESGNIQVIPSNECGNGPVQTLTVITQTVPNQPSAISGDTNPCQGTSVTYNVSQIADVTYTWIAPINWNITSGQGTNEVIVNADGATGYIEVTPSNACGIGMPRTLAVTSITIPSQPADIAGAFNPCLGTMETYSTNQVAGITYSWSVPADWSITTGQGTQEVMVIVGEASGNIEVTPSNACGSGIAQILAANSQTFPSQLSAIAGATNPCLGAMEIYSTNQEAGLTYTWTVPADWSITSGQGTHEITVSVGSMTGTIEVFPSNVCGDTIAQTLGVTSFTVIEAPTLMSAAASGISAFSASAGGEVIHTGCAAVIARGVVWSTTQNPSLESNLGMTSNGVGAGSFTSHLLGLTPNTTYYVRAYATNSVGTAYGNEVSFSTRQEQAGTTQLTLPLPDPCSSLVPAKEANQP